MGDYPALTHVEDELAAIEEAFGGRKLLNEEFSVGALERELRETQFGIVHIASHGEFSADAGETFLLTHDPDEPLTMDRLAELVGITEFREQPLELLTLSACQTAAGDERAALGLAGVAVKAGARSTLATLWYIDDRASADLVAEFYRHLTDPEVSRAEALRQAQLSLVRDPSYRHPGYWSPFLLISNWL